MKIELDENEYLPGVKIFDGIDKETNLPYCKPDDYKQIYQKGENVYDGEIEICRRGFHFSMSIREAYNYKSIIGLQCSRRNAVLINPVFEVHATGKIFSETYNTHGGFEQKFVTDHLYLDRQVSNRAILIYLVTNNLCYIKTFIDTNVSTSSITGNIRCLYQGNAKEITIDSLPSVKNFTIFSDYSNKLIVKNKTKYTHYVNRCEDKFQHIEVIPRYSTVEFKQYNIFGNKIS